MLTYNSSHSRRTLSTRLAADGWVVGVAKVFFDTLLQRVNASPNLLGVMGAENLLKGRAGVGGARGNVGAGEASRKKRFGGFEKVLGHMLVFGGKGNS